MLSELRVGEVLAGSGTVNPARGDITGAWITTDAHGRFAEAARRGRLFSGGSIVLQAINNATFTIGTLGTACTPIVGLWNPSTNQVNLEVLQASLGVTMSALIATGGGPYMWAISTGNNAISTGSQPFNRRTLTQSGSNAKVFGGAAALTGLTNNLVVMNGSALFGGSALSISFTATAVAMQTQQLASVENIDGSIIVPPGGVLALLAAVTPVAHSVVSGIVWEDVPILT